MIKKYYYKSNITYNKFKMSLNQHNITFYNNTNIPVSLETWQQKCYGLNVYNDICINIGEKINMPSSTGEWYITTDIHNKEIEEKIKSLGYKLGIEIEKFRNKPCIRGDYYWLYKNDFKFEHTDGLITLNNV